MSENNNNGEQKITKAVDKLVMGMIIGGAVGSVLGMALAPKSGKENRKIAKKKVMEVKEMATEMKDKAEDFGKNFINEHEDDIDSAKEIIKGKSKGVFSFVKKTLGIKKNKKKIPHEIDA